MPRVPSASEAWGLLQAAKDHPPLAQVLNELRELDGKRFRVVTRDWRLFRRFARSLRAQALPAEPMTLIRFIQALKPHYTAGTVADKIGSINYVHALAGYRRPSLHQTVIDALETLRRTKPKKKAAPPMPREHFELLMDDLRGNDLAALRNRAALSCAYFGQLAPAELATPTFESTTITDTELVLRNVGFAGRTVRIAAANDKRRCAVRAVRAWLRKSKITSGPLFRSLSSVGSLTDRPLSSRTLFSAFTAIRERIPELRKYTFESLRNGALIGLWDSDTPTVFMMERGGFRNTQSLYAFLRRHAKGSGRYIPPARNRHPKRRRRGPNDRIPPRRRDERQWSADDD